MKALPCVLYAVLLASPFVAAAEEDDSARIFRYVTREGVTNEWYLPFERILKSPRWDPLRGDPPLSVSNAVAVASASIKKRIGVTRWEVLSGHPDLLQSLSISSLHSDKEPFARFFYYTMMFRTGDFESEACIVLMDGNVLEPKRAGSPKSSSSPTEAPPNTPRPQKKPS